MVTTRSSRRAQPPQESAAASSSSEQEETPHVTEDSSLSESSAAAAAEPPPPKPISSSEEDEPSSSPAVQKGSSRLFSPYRTLGIVSSGRPYHVQSHTNSTNALVTLAIGERFHVVQCDRLQPVLVSQAVHGPPITHLVSDSALSITVVTHSTSSLSLYHRTRPIQTIQRLASSSSSRQWSVVDLLHLGRTKVAMGGEKEGTMENAVVVAVVLAKHEDEESAVPIVGDDDSSSDEEQEESDSDDDDDDESTLDDSQAVGRGQVVMLLATRSSIRIQKRIVLTSVPTFQPTTAMHPSTYLNKIVLGGTNASPILLNVRTGKVIHVFTCLSPSTITAMEQSPAVDTIAVGTSSGAVHLVNLRHDKKLFSLQHPSAVTSLSFRTDGSAMRYGIAPLAVGRIDGTISVWDLTPPQEEGMGRTLLCQLEKVHPGGVAKLSYFSQEPLLLSTGITSNSLLMHLFDSPDHSGRLLRQRRGHVTPPKHIRYLHPGNGGVLANTADGTDASSCQILSGGGSDRTLRVFSTARSVLDREYSQGKGLEKKAKQLGLEVKAELLLPPVTATATCDARSRDWGDLVTIHRNHAFAYVWSTKRGAQSGPILRQSNWNVSAMQVPPPKSVHATSLAMSACGSFAVVGTAGGTIYKYNVQSGLARGSYPKDATEKQDRKGKPRMAGDVSRTMKALEKKMKVSNRATNLDRKERDEIEEARLERIRLAKLARASHTGASVTGLAVDSVNKALISVGSDSKLILWNFATHAPHKKSPYKLPSPATKLCHARESDLAAIAMADFTVVLFDCATLSIVRRFGVGGDTVRHTGPISDLAFSPDGRSLYTSSLDGSVRVWDVPTNTCVDWLGFHTPPTSLTVSPTGEFLATTHVDKVGISLWSDRTFYQTVQMDGAHPPTEPARMDDPTPIAEKYDESEDHVANRAAPVHFAARRDQDHGDDVKVPPVAKEHGLITLSGMPPAHWKNLFHLELVKERNKPKEAPKKPPSAPFFLQWRGGETLGGEPAQANLHEAQGDKADEAEWDAVWSDDDDKASADVSEKKRGIESTVTVSDSIISQPKRQKIGHYRSHLAALLEKCAERPHGDSRFHVVTEHLATLGPSAIDVSLSTLCSGMHDLEGGLPLLHKASLWLLEACQSRQRYEAVNAYLHRFLYLHANVLAGIDSSPEEENEAEITEEEIENKQRLQVLRRELLETVVQLKEAQQSASDALRGKMQHTLCLLRHFSRMV